jgi:hypothetical protein
MDFEIKDGFMVFSPGRGSLMGFLDASLIRGALSKATQRAKHPQILCCKIQTVRLVDAGHHGG